LVELHRGGIPAGDLYGYYIPNMLHAVRSVGQDGKGLLWNPFQGGGGPFFANSQTGLLYPPHLLFLLLPVNAAAHAVLIVNMVLGATGMFLLARELGLSWVAALAGALAFEIGDPMVQFAGWSPMTNGSWAWVSWVVLCCERLLRAPSRAGVIGLVLALALQLLSGTTLIAALTYQLIVLRVVWEIFTRRPRGQWSAVLAIALGLVLAPLLTAVQLLPMAEFASQSLRVTLPVGSWVDMHSISAAQLLGSMAQRALPIPFLIIPLVLAVVAPFASATRRLAIFYLITGTLYGVLALGGLTPLFWLYAFIPPGGMVLRVPDRLFWITGFCLAVLTALGVEALTGGGDRSRVRWRRSIVAVALSAAFWGFAPGGLRWTEGVALAATVGAAVAADARPVLRQAAAWIVLAALALNLISVPLRWWGRLLPSADALWAQAPTFTALAPSISAQDRVLLLPDTATSLGLGLTLRTSSVLGVRNFSDYENLPGRRFTEYFSMCWDAPVSDITDPRWKSWQATHMLRRLLDLASVRYVIKSPPANAKSPPVDLVAQTPGLQRVTIDGSNLHIYRNDSALPRARFVGRIEVVTDPSALLERLAHGDDDLASVAFVEDPPPSGFTGADGVQRPGTARFETNDPEHLVIDVDAPQRGFLLLSDNYYPGWRATVNGAPVPIQRANYLFRLIEVPAGRSRVEFRFRPTSLAVGGVVSGLTIAAVGVTLFLGRRR
jgi:hypothetical protein